MKKYFEKHDLVKIALIVLFITVLFTWIFPECYFNNGELALANAEKFGFMTLVDADYRLGIFDIVTYTFLSFYYFIDIFMFILMVGGFYKFIGSLRAYDAVTTSIAKMAKGKESAFAAITILIFTVLASVVINPLILLVFIPFILSVVAKLKIDRVSGVAIGFGGLLLGNLASMYSASVAGALVNALKVSYGFETIAVLLVGLAAYVIFTVLTIARMNKQLKNKDAKVLEDVFITEFEEKPTLIKKLLKNGKVKKVTKKTPKVNKMPFIVVSILTSIIIILAFLDWTNIFKVTLFTDIYNDITNATVGNIKIFYYLLGSVDLSGEPTFTAFGSWSLFSVCSTLAIATFILKIMYRKKFSDVLDEYGAGVKAIGRAFAPFMVCYLVLEFSVLFVRIPGILAWILGFGKNFFTLYLCSFVSSIFTVQFQYNVSLLSTVYVAYENVNVAALALQFSNGLLAFFGPTSALLFFGLGLTGTRYSEWFKHIWKFVLAMLVITIATIAVIALI